MSSDDELLDRLDKDHAPAWRPVDGDKIVGRVVEIGSYDGGYGPYPIYTVTVTAGTQETRSLVVGVELAVHALGQVLVEKLATVRIGDRIAVKNLGKKPQKKGTGTYADWRVIVDQAPSSQPTAASAPAPAADDIL